MLLVVLICAVRGVISGAVRQCFGILGALAGLWVALWIARWVGHHWSGARPVLVFGFLRWLVAALGGFAVATLFQFWGDAVGGAVGKSGAGLADRAAGSVFGALVGTVVVTLVLLLALLTRWPSAVRITAARARLAVPLMSAGARVSSVEESIFPGSAWLRRKFLDAERRARERGSSS